LVQKWSAIHVESRTKCCASWEPTKVSVRSPSPLWHLTQIIRRRRQHRRSKRKLVGDQPGRRRQRPLLTKPSEPKSGLVRCLRQANAPRATSKTAPSARKASRSRHQPLISVTGHRPRDGRCDGGRRGKAVAAGTERAETAASRARPADFRPPRRLPPRSVRSR